eukprot:CAMPEP_0202421604 /NCGR_PEP_ID=MMETSP1128-20130828/50425_1 /ASSEMBLY_ACC=CAM_ASM_000463 /TAXON_ID=3047 /ORGANISM="Dunaliella tertiolecta, Strain CCMP1320" /LENGTH=213 /DNA_ID=CAMNT_0049029633 /DNA_START=761 /DNA_END=1402 /DNA_ORIENTATION=+
MQVPVGGQKIGCPQLCLQPHAELLNAHCSSNVGGLLGSSVVWIMLLWGQAQCAWSERPAGGLGIAALLCMLALRPLLLLLLLLMMMGGGGRVPAAAMEAGCCWWSGERLLLLLLMMMGGGGRVPAAAMEAGCCWWSGERAGVAGVRWPIFPWPSMRAALSASTGRKLLAVLTGVCGIYYMPFPTPAPALVHAVAVAVLPFRAALLPILLLLCA